MSRLTTLATYIGIAALLPLLNAQPTITVNTTLVCILLYSI